MNDKIRIERNLGWAVEYIPELNAYKLPNSIPMDEITHEVIDELYYEGKFEIVVAEGSYYVIHNPDMKLPEYKSPASTYELYREVTLDELKNCV